MFWRYKAAMIAWSLSPTQRALPMGATAAKPATTPQARTIADIRLEYLKHHAKLAMLWETASQAGSSSCGKQKSWHVKCRRLRVERHVGTTSTLSFFEEHFSCVCLSCLMPALRTLEPCQAKSAYKWKVRILHPLHWPSDGHIGTNSGTKRCLPKVV